MNEDTKALAILRAIDAYVIAQRSSMENGGRRWNFIDNPKRAFEAEPVAPVDAGIEAFTASLAAQGLALTELPS